MTVLKYIRYGALALIVITLGVVGRYTLFQEAPFQKAPFQKAPASHLGGAFSLSHVAGKTVTDRDFHGVWTLVFFGYTHCPDVCPTGLQIMSDALHQLPPTTAEKVQPLFISLDPGRDTPEHVDEYAKAFHPKFIGLTGSLEDVTAMAKAYRVFFRKSPGSVEGSKDYTLDHSSATYLMNPDGIYDTWFSGDTSAEAMAQSLAARI